jgi:hypothetical protein
MELEKQVCNLELASRLKELGVKQESAFHWHQYADQKPYLKTFENLHPSWSGASAFTVAELGLLLGHRMQSGYNDERGFYCSWDGTYHDVEQQWADTEADARAKMLIYPNLIVK